MSRLRKFLEDYLSIRRALGYKLERVGDLLSNFVAFAECSGRPFITVELALAWANQPTDVSAYWASRRLAVVRVFARHVQAFDPRTEVPPADLLPHRKDRLIPYLYSDADVRALMQACQRLRGPLISFTHSTLIGLLATTGIRIGEAVDLDRADMDEREKVLLIRNAKFGKTREVLIHNTTIQALKLYAQKRDQIIPRCKCPGFFVSQAGSRLLQQNVWFQFARLRRWAGLPDRPRSPRIHDFRHSFAIKTLIRWYRDGEDIDPRLPLLSTYLGHVNPSSTYWYLTAVPELMGLAAERLEDQLGELP